MPHFGEGHSYQKKFEKPWPWLIGYQQIKGEGGAHGPEPLDRGDQVT
jgi:hypothetical protein